MIVEFDIRGVRQQTRLMKRVRDSLQNTGAGEVITSIRKKTNRKERKPLHGKAIANIMRRRGIEPFEHVPKAVAFVQRRVQKAIVKTIELAQFRATADNSPIKRALLDSAEFLAIERKEFIKRGKLGRNSSYWAQTKDRMAGHGIIPDNHPYGIFTGRFVAGIRGRWRLGKRRD